MAVDQDGLEPGSRSGSRVTRTSLAAGLAFMEAARAESLHLAELTTWLREHLVEPGLMEMPVALYEPGVATVPITSSNRSSAATYDMRAARMMATARVRVAVTLAGLVARPADDRFLSAAIFAGRVTRTTTEQRSAWQPSPDAGARLSDMVLACFAADALEHRSDYDERLCVCDICGRVAFAADALLRTRCAQHAG